MTSTRANPADEGGALKNTVLGGTASASTATNRQFQASNSLALDLFGEPTAPPQIVRLDRHCDRIAPCCDNLATIHPRYDGPHAAELRCAGCDKHRGWLPKVALDFLAETTKRFGAPTHPITLRDSTIGDHSMNPQRDNSGILFKNDRKAIDTQPDYTGNATVGGVEFRLSAWVKQGAKGKFMSLSLTPKDAAKPAAKATAKSDAPFDDAIGF
jgi:hypothetical protein